ncbi:PhoPQ-activated protein PqaA family protein [Parendozoicomonas sp. Alg238-R29]|uniref:PhoPQ-activated protein PqaA family protein n=1 Tax=Parendozoicomonas sp. Alg238-R29 TaxID=2993446 RepID=UPI00248DAC63|nr:PhoPQ-activated protein PqaA family protein [Parendozoicomonas sp. Alg238-R29]
MSGERVVATSGALVEYINKPDTHFQWRVLGSRQIDGLNIVDLTMTSQSWSPDSLKSNHPHWQHRITVYIPVDVKRQPAVLHVNGGVHYGRDNNTTADISDELRFEDLATLTGSVVINLRDVPQQYLSLNNEAPRKEDDLVARSWVASLNDPECSDCPIQFPMVKSVVKAMNAVQELLNERLGSRAPESFILTGASKRGWAAWLTSAVDRRVQAVIPMVIDVLNVQECLDHLHRVYKGWIPPLQPYLSENQNVLTRLHTSEMNQLMSKVDPWFYRDYLTLPKYVVTASGDDFFPPDSSRVYWSGLMGPKWMRAYPNARHYISRENIQRVTDTIVSYVNYLVSGQQPPAILSQNTVGRQVSVTVSGKPDEVKLWQVINPEVRDFRMTTLKPAGLAYQAVPIKVECGSSERTCVVLARVEAPVKGWKSWFLEFTYKQPSQPDFIITTPVTVIPDTYSE